MASGVTGDFSGLASLIGKFEKMAASNFRRTLNRNLADAAREEVSKSFDSERDPYDKAWRPLKPATLKARRGGGIGGKILQNNRVLRNSITASGSWSSDADGFAVGTNVEYAAIHNYGGEGAGRPDIPQRQFIPDKAHGLGSRWTKALKTEAEKTVEDAMGGK